jgi:hypothetical protein
MRNVTVRIPAAEFSATMNAIDEWLYANRWEPTRYTYDHNEDAVLVTIDFAGEVAPEEFAARFDIVCGLPRKPTSPDLLPSVA